MPPDSLNPFLIAVLCAVRSRRYQRVSAAVHQKWYSTRTIGVFAKEPGTDAGLPNLLRQY